MVYMNRKQEIIVHQLMIRAPLPLQCCHLGYRSWSLDQLLLLLLDRWMMAAHLASQSPAWDQDHLAHLCLSPPPKSSGHPPDSAVIRIHDRYVIFLIHKRLLSYTLQESQRGREGYGSEEICLLLRSERASGREGAKDDG